jgi:hypothetical protein
MTSKESKPWMPRWVRKQLRARNNDLPPNDPNRDNKPSVGADPPLCKCEMECHCYYSLDYNTYGRRYWGCKLPLSPFNYEEEQLRNVVSVFKIYRGY